MTQPPLGHSLSQLEKSIGVKLIERTAKGVQPTEAGRHLDHVAQRMLADIDGLVYELQAIDAGHSGIVSVAAVPPFMWEAMPKLLRNFVNTAQDVDINLSEMPLQFVLDAVERGKADVGFIVTSEAEQIERRFRGVLQLKAYQSIPYVAVLPREMDYLMEPLDLTAVDGETWIVPRAAEQMVAIWSSYGVRPSRVRVVETLQTAVPLISAGLGIALMPGSFLELGIRSVITRSIRQPIPPLESTILWRSDHSLNATLKRFVDFALQQVEED